MLTCEVLVAEGNTNLSHHILHHEHCFTYLKKYLSHLKDIWHFGIHRGRS